MSGTFIFGLLRWLSRLRFLTLAGFVLFMVNASPSYSAENSLDTSVVRLRSLVAEVVPGILGYARWPDEVEQSSKRLCLVGPTEYTDELLDIVVTVPGWNPSVQRVSFDYEGIAIDCQAVYIGVLLDNERAELFSRLDGRAILTISEQNDSCAVNTLFCLRIDEDSVGFEVNLDSVERSGIQINPNVLRLGQRPREEP